MTYRRSIEVTGPGMAFVDGPPTHVHRFRLIEECDCCGSQTDLYATQLTKTDREVLARNAGRPHPVVLRLGDGDLVEHRSARPDPAGSAPDPAAPLW